jgi:hypothetical protein
MKKRGPGRPKLTKSKARGSVYTIRLLASERKAVGDAARRAGKKLSDWTRDVLREASRVGKTTKGSEPEDARIELHGVSAPRPLDVKPS